MPATTASTDLAGLRGCHRYPGFVLLTAGMEYCEFVDVSKVASQRRGTEMEVTWEVTATRSIRRATTSMRQIAPDEQWVRLNSGLDAPGRWRPLPTDRHGSEPAGDVRYRLEHVTLDGRGHTLLAKVTDHDPTPPLPRGLVRTLSDGASNLRIFTSLITPKRDPEHEGRIADEDVGVGRRVLHEAVGA